MNETETAVGRLKLCLYGCASLEELVPVLPSPRILLPEAWEMFLPKQKWRQFRIGVMKLHSDCNIAIWFVSLIQKTRLKI